MRIAAGAALAAVLLLAACQREKTAEDQARPDRRLVIAVIPKGTTHEFWKTVHAGAVKASRELGVDIIWKGPLKEDDREAQIKVVEDFLSRGVSGIVLAPLDDTALRAPVRNAAHSGIPVVIIDSGLKSGDYTSFVATDNLKGGELAGERLAELVGESGKVMMLRYMEGSASTGNREQGFLAAIARHPGITVVSSNQYGGATTESAYQASENLLARLKAPDGSIGVDGVFCPNESSTFGMLRALQDGGLAGKVRFVGFDSSTKLVEALQNGEIDALVMQNPMLMGYLGVKTMVLHLRTEPVEKRIDTGVTLVTRANMSEPGIKELLEPDNAKWLNE
ncbi:MAG TPA: substrate-binding domain-containing protein [bacterium]|nr:substrate-binding domain-containing protein [bacterium]